MAYSQYAPPKQSSFSGVVKESFKGKEQGTSVLVGGKVVAKVSPSGGGTSYVKPGEKAVLTFNEQGQQVEVTSKQLSSSTLQRQNVINEAETIRRDQSLVLQTKQEAPEPMRFGYDSTRLSRVELRKDGVVSLGFPIGTAEESARARSMGQSIFPTSQLSSVSKPEQFIQDVSLASDIITGYSSSKARGAFIATQQSFGNVGAVQSALAQTQKTMQIESMQSQQFPQSKDYTPMFKSLVETNLKSIASENYKFIGGLLPPKKEGYGDIAFDSLPTKQKLLGNIFEVGVAIDKTTLGIGEFFLSGLSGQVKEGQQGFSSKLTFIGGNLQRNQQRQLSGLGNLTQFGLIAVPVAGGLGQVGKIYKAERALGLSRGQALNIAGGELLEGLSPIQFKKTYLISSKTSLDLQTSRPTARTFELKQFNEGKGILTTSQGTRTTISQTEIKYLSLYKPRLFETKGINFIDTGSLKSLGEVRSLNYFTTMQTSLTPENLGVTRKFDEKNFLGILKGKRETLAYTSQLIGKDKYTLGLNKIVSRELSGFSVTGKFRVLKSNEGLTQLGIGKSTGKFKPFQREVFTFNDQGRLLSGEFSGFKYSGKLLPGRASIARSFETYKGLGRVSIPEGTLTFGKTSAIGRVKGKPFIAGFKTEYYQLNKFTGDSEFTSFRGRGRQTPFSLDLNTKQIQTQISQSLTGKALISGIKLPKTINLKSATTQRLIPITSTITSQITSQSLTTSQSLIQAPSLGLISSTKLGTSLISSQSLIAQTRLTTTPSLSLITPPSISTPSIPFTPIITPNIPVFLGLPSLPSLGGYVIPKTRSKGKKTGSFRIAPSFTALQLGIKIKSPVKQSKTFGVTPFQRRGIYKGKGPYSKLVDF